MVMDPDPMGCLPVVYQLNHWMGWNNCQLEPRTASRGQNQWWHWKAGDIFWIKAPHQLKWNNWRRTKEWFYHLLSSYLAISSNLILPHLTSSLSYPSGLPAARLSPPWCKYWADSWAKFTEKPTENGDELLVAMNKWMSPSGLINKYDM